jgi:TRAP-type C4-dicarboxylate transport system substrate-binding protein
MTTTPIKNMEDLKKAKIRIPPNPVLMRMFDAWGITPTPIAWGELFNAMQLKVVDGFECDATVLISNRYNEVVTYITDIDYRLQISTLVMNVDSYNSLSEDFQQVINKAAAATMQYMRGQSDYLVQYCIDESPTVNFLGAPEDLAVWRDKARSIWPEFYELIGDGDATAGKAVVEAVVEAAK